MNLIFIIIVSLMIMKLPLEIISFRRDKNDKKFRTKIINHWITTVGLLLAMIIVMYF
jgi:hypothetical protein